MKIPFFFQIKNVKKNNLMEDNFNLKKGSNYFIL